MSPTTILNSHAELLHHLIGQQIDYALVPDLQIGMHNSLPHGSLDETALGPYYQASCINLRVKFAPYAACVFEHSSGMACSLYFEHDFAFWMNFHPEMVKGIRKEGSMEEFIC